MRLGLSSRELHHTIVDILFVHKIIKWSIPLLRSHASTNDLYNYLNRLYTNSNRFCHATDLFFL